MVLKHADELRHRPDEDPNWRESLYFNFNDPVSGIGCWLYLWVNPNKATPAGMLVSFYKGAWRQPDLLAAMTAQPGHFRRDGDRWIYLVRTLVETPLAADFDDVELCGLRFRRQAPFGGYTLSYQDDAGNGFELDAQFLMDPYDYADGANPCPAWVAANRYHRSWRAKGVLRIGGEIHAVDCTGDSDHSWGPRDHDGFARTLFKYWAFQTPDGRAAVSAVQFARDEATVDLGFVRLDGRLSSVRSIAAVSDYDAAGVQEGMVLSVTDADDRVVTARCASMHSYIDLAGWNPLCWGYEGVGAYDIDGIGQAHGMSSYFWPRTVSPELLGRAKVRSRT